jgi:hypothetical protein
MSNMEIFELRSQGIILWVSNGLLNEVTDSRQRGKEKEDQEEKKIRQVNR